LEWRRYYKDKGVEAVDPLLFAKDTRYAAEVLQKAFQSTQPNLVAAALSLANILGLLNGPERSGEPVATRADAPRDRPPREPEIAKAESPPPPLEQKWVRSIR
jgi:hypothetical protein